MKSNMGKIDRVVRILIAITLGVLFWQGIITGILAYVLITFSLIFLLTSFISFCPLYTLIGVNTCKVKK